MKRLFFCALSLCLLGLTAPASAAPSAPADGLKMEMTKKAVTFNHSSHAKLECVVCHHQVNGKENFAKCGNAGCHDSMDRADKSAKGYFHMIHAKADTKFQTCLACHTEVVAGSPDRKKELTGCKGSKCHP